MNPLSFIKSRIFLKILLLCLCSILLVQNISTTQNLLAILGIIFCAYAIVRSLNKELDRFEDQVIQNCLEAQRQPTHKEIIVDAEDFTVLN